jgi:hypothetical protein
MKNSNFRIGNWKVWLPAALLLAPSLLFAGQFSINWFKVAGGGNTSTGVTFVVSGTAGQPDAGQAMSGARYTVTGGFWAIYAVNTPGAPRLAITYSGNRAIVSWATFDTGWILQTNNNLATGTWGNYLGGVNNNSATNTPPRGNLFFRLSHP